MQTWAELYGQDTTPTLEQIAAYIQSPLWDALCGFLETSYGSVPHVSYSRCASAPGWNVKYRKGSRALCTLYPAAGSFTAMVSIGAREAPEAERRLPAMTPCLQSLYAAARPLNGARWLMIPVKDGAILQDTKELIRCV